jgi:serine/threonine protein kinase
VIHRDLQIDNILYVRNDSGGSSYQVKITDFGTSQLPNRAASSLTQSLRPDRPHLLVNGSVHVWSQVSASSTGMQAIAGYRPTPTLAVLTVRRGRPLIMLRRLYKPLTTRLTGHLCDRCGARVDCGGLHHTPVGHLPGPFLLLALPSSFTPFQYVPEF